MDLPTYTNIWRIEKRLYKLYDFRLPMPLPVGQIAVFAAIAVPYVLALTMLGLPFSHTLLWLYVLPPAVLAWLATRPVLESKRLPELVHSQLRYLSEPRTWCRLAPLAERDEINVTCRVWRQAAPPPAAAARPRALAAARAQRPPAALPPAVPPPAEAPPAALPPAEAPAAEAPAIAAAHAETSAAAQVPRRVPVSGVHAADVVLGPGFPETEALAVSVPQITQHTAGQARRPVVTVTAEPSRPLRVVERALNGRRAQRTGGWHDQVVVVPGGHRPGRPDQQQRDRARARLAITGPRRIVVLGCTVGAGQTVTALLTGEMLAGLRADPVAVLDLNPGSGSLAQRARTVPALDQAPPRAGRPADQGRAASPDPSRLEVITANPADARGGPEQQDQGALFELVSARYPLTLADPAAPAVPRVLAVADQLVLVAPVSADAASALALTHEWLEAHGHGLLAAGSITVLNGVSPATMAHVENAETVARGRSRAIVRVPWDDALRRPAARPVIAAAPGALSLPAVHAYTALAGVLVAGLADAPQLRSARP